MFRHSNGRNIYAFVYKCTGAFLKSLNVEVSVRLKISLVIFILVYQACIQDFNLDVLV